MTFLKSLVPALALSFFVFSPAQAMTPASAAIGLGQAADSHVIDVQAGPRHRSGPRHAQPRHVQPRHVQPRHGYPRHRYTPGHRYRSAPHGWRQHRTRPGDWRTRGCIMVGPLWFCP